MALNPSIFKAYDIRGIYPTELDEDGMQSIIKGLYTFYTRNIGRNPLTVVLSRDMRMSSPSLHDVAAKNLVAMGAKVLDIGLASTPTAYFATRHLKADLCIHITASHNPKEYNGIKFVKRSGDVIEKPSGSYGVKDIKTLVLAGDFLPDSPNGSIENIPHIEETEVDYFISMLPVKPVKRYRIVADPANAMGSMYLNALAKKINIELIRMNFELDGSFPAHQADPSQSSTLRSLQKKVVESRADFGIGTDGDGDRIVFVNEKGDIVPTSYMASLIAKQILEEKPGATIIGNVQKIFNIQRNVERLGGVFDQVRVGHTFITNRINNEPIEFCGEISGHYFFKKNGGAESSILVFLYIIKALNESGKSLSQTLLEFKRAEEKEEMNFVVPSKDTVQAILTKLESEYKDATVEKIDGVTVVTPEWRVNIRTSNTEPLLRLNVEGDSLDIVNSKFSEMSQLIEAQGGKLKTGH